MGAAMKCLRVMLLTFGVLCHVFSSASGTASPVPVWHGKSPRDLHREYGNIFKYGNRNAASHLWSSFIMDRAPQMTHSRFETLSAGYCAVSGSPVTPHDHTRYLLRLESVEGNGKMVAGFMYYCCWPCVCDTQDFLKVDTTNITLAGEVRRYHVVVIGNPCDHSEALQKPFMQPFGHGMTTLADSAAEVRCDASGNLVGATLSDHGYPIVSLFFDPQEIDANSKAVVAGSMGHPEPGRMGRSKKGLAYQDEFEYRDMCEDRAANGYNSGMGEIFRKVAEISRIIPGSRPRVPEALTSESNESTGGNESDL